MYFSPFWKLGSKMKSRADLRSGESSLPSQTHLFAVPWHDGKCKKIFCPPDLTTSLRPTSKYDHTGDWISTYEFGGDINIRSIAGLSLPLSKNGTTIHQSFKPKIHPGLFSLILPPTSESLSKFPASSAIHLKYPCHPLHCYHPYQKVISHPDYSGGFLTISLLQISASIKLVKK